MRRDPIVLPPSPQSTTLNEEGGRVKPQPSKRENAKGPRVWDAACIFVMRTRYRKEKCDDSSPLAEMEMVATFYGMSK